MSYKQVQTFVPLNDASGHGQEIETNEQLRQNFSKQLKICVKRAYSGKIPSYAVIARDYSLRANGEAVSAETIRKWMQGISVPQSGRLRTLIQWLGFELAEALHLVAENSHKKTNMRLSTHDSVPGITPQNDKYGIDDYLEMRISLLIKKLSRRDRNMVLSMLEALRQSRENSNE